MDFDIDCGCPFNKVLSVWFSGWILPLALDSRLILKGLVPSFAPSLDWSSPLPF